MPKLVLWGSKGTTSTICHTVLAEAGAAFETRFLSMRDGLEHRQPEYLAINPKGEVPALTVDGAVITEVPAICLYVAEAFPNAKLLPGDPLARAQAVSWLAWASFRQAAAFFPAFAATRLVAGEEAAAALRAAALERIGAAMAYLGTTLAGQEYLMGAHATLGDFYVAAQERWAGRLGLTLPASCAAHLARMHARPAVQRVFGIEGITP